VAVAAQTSPTPPSAPSAVSPEALRVVPADLPVAALRTVGVEPVIIEVADAPAPAEQAAPQAMAPAVAPPRVLGEMVMRPGWSLSKTAARLYGSGGRRVMSDVAAANPGIADLDLVRPGAKVAFPARQVDPLPVGTSVVLFERKTDLDAAFAALAALRDSVPQVVLYAHFSPRSGLVFDVVLDRYHSDAASAQKALDALPHGVAVKAQVVEYLDDATVAYSVLEPAAATGPGTVRTVAQNAALPQ
jgi:general secretion pathway protein A